MSVAVVAACLADGSCHVEFESGISVLSQFNGVSLFGTGAKSGTGSSAGGITVVVLALVPVLVLVLGLVY